jgi:hypothetical protein
MRRIMFNLKVHRKQLVTTTLMASAMVLMSQLASATPITGSGGPFSGVLNGGTSVQVTGTCINFFSATPISACGSPASFTVTPASSDAQFTGTGSIQDFNSANQQGTTPPSAPYINGTAFTTLGAYSWDVTRVIIPNAAPCTPPGAPVVCSFGVFTITQSDLNSTTNCPVGFNSCGVVSVAFGASGIGYSGTSATGSTPYTYSFTSQFNNQTIQNLLILASSVGVSNSVSLTYTPNSVVPEPGEFALVGTGLMGLGLVSRYFRRKARKG